MSRNVLMFAAMMVSISAHGACSTAPDAKPLHLVELYTSEGCSSCPPADKWMSAVGGKPDFVGIEFHVDYWDSSEFRDPFSDRAYTKRQETLVKRGEHEQSYTPQIWLDGQLWHNWPQGAPPSGSSGADAPVHIEADIADPTTTHVSITRDGKQNVYVALTENGLSTAVHGGENKGKTLAHDHVVRAFAGPFDQAHIETDLKIPKGVVLSKSAIVAFAADDRNGSISRVARLPLDSCAK
ncbi:MAG: DUF1223 domain-containing protein [Rudaea sp.]